jgi:hypothetical protein
MNATEAAPVTNRTKHPDPTVVDSHHYSVEFENDSVRVLRIKYGPKDTGVMHWHPSHIGIFLTDANVRFTSPDGAKETADIKAGQVLNFPPMQHLPENLGDTPFEVIAVEIKS